MLKRLDHIFGHIAVFCMFFQLLHVIKKNWSFLILIFFHILFEYQRAISQYGNIDQYVLNLKVVVHNTEFNAWRSAWALLYVQVSIIPFLSFFHILSPLFSHQQSTMSHFYITFNLSNIHFQVEIGMKLNSTVSKLQMDINEAVRDSVGSITASVFRLYLSFKNFPSSSFHLQVPKILVRGFPNLAI